MTSQTSKPKPQSEHRHYFKIDPSIIDPRAGYGCACGETRPLDYRGEALDGFVEADLITKDQARRNLGIPGPAQRLTVYIAGPMTGYEGSNYRAFHRAAADLRKSGHIVLNPAENPAPNPNPTWQDWMRAALAQLIQADAVALLPGHRDSKGAMIEERIGRDLGLDVRPVMHFLDNEHQNWCDYTPAARTK